METLSTANMPPIASSHPAVAIKAVNPAEQPFVAAAATGANGGGGTGIDAIVNAISANNSAKRGDLIDPMPKPVQSIYTVNNEAGDDAAAIIAYFLNEDLLTATTTNNGSGADSVITTYNDGFSGNLLSQISLIYGLEGLPYKQFQLTFTDNTTGEQDKASLSSSNPRKISYNGDTTSQVQLLALASAGNPAYYQAGFLIIDVNFRMRRNEQILINVPVNKTATMILVPAW